MAISKPKIPKFYYPLLVLPFVLMTVSWLGFPALAGELSRGIFGYEPEANLPSTVWNAAALLFYSWFTFLAIGVGGLLVVGAWLSRRNADQRAMRFYPMVSFVVPAYNEEKALPKCINSLFACSVRYPGPIEIIVVDDGSGDSSYEASSGALQSNVTRYPKVRGRVMRHMANLGKVEALRTGVNRALGQVVAVVDADSWWHAETLRALVEYMQADGKVAVTGYVHPTDNQGSPLVFLQQLEYSQGLGVFRCAQALGNVVTVVPGAMGLFDAGILRSVLNGQNLKSVAEDSEITLELQKQGCKVGYLSEAKCGTVAPSDFGSFWNQRLRWFVGWLHNVLGVHRDALQQKRWLTLLLWYSLIVEYFGAFIEIAALASFPFLFWFAPDRVSFLLNLFWFGGYALTAGVVAQAIALRFAYGKCNYRGLLYYTPFYSILWIVNLWARLASLVSFALGSRGSWKQKNRL